MCQADVKWPGFVSSSGDNQRLSGGQVYTQVLTHNELMYIQAMTWDWKVQEFKFPG